MHFTQDDCRAMPGRWSLWPAAVETALNAVAWDRLPLVTGHPDEAPVPFFSVLELGAGAGTAALNEILRAKPLRYNYISLESNAKYLAAVPGVLSVHQPSFPDDLLQVLPTTFGKADLIIVDGPNGVIRSRWYPLLRPLVRRGTVLLLDDFDHFPEFAQALDSNFNYQLIDHVNLGKPASGGSVVCWRIVRILSPIYPEQQSS